MRFRDNSQTHIPQHRHPRITIGHISGSGRTVVSVTDRRPAVLLVVKLVSRWQLFLSSTINGNSQLKEPWARIRLDPETLSRAVEKNVTVRLWSSDVFSYDVVEFWWWWWRRGLKSTWFRLEYFLDDISIKLALVSCLSPFIRTRTCRLHMSSWVSNLDDYQNRYSACFQSSVSVIFYSQIADKICYFRNVPLWLWCSILSNNVPPATISDASQITAHKHWVIWICRITSLNISNKRRAEGE